MKIFNISISLIVILLLGSNLHSQELRLSKTSYLENDIIEVKINSLKELKLETGYCILVSNITEDIEYIYVGTDNNQLHPKFPNNNNPIKFTRHQSVPNDGYLSVKDGETFTALVSIYENGNPYILSQIGLSGYVEEIVKDRFIKEDKYSKINKKLYDQQLLIFSTGNDFPVAAEKNTVILHSNSPNERMRFEKQYSAYLSNQQLIEFKGGTSYSLYNIENYDKGLILLAHSLKLKNQYINYSSEKDLSVLDFISHATFSGYNVSVNNMVFKNNEIKTNRNDITDFLADRIGRSFTDTLYNIPQLWELMAIYDFDEKEINPGIIDLGFKSRYEDVSNNDLSSRQISINGNSPSGTTYLAGDRGNHGIGVQSIIAGEINNGGFSAGIAGQVAKPITCRLPSGVSFVFGLAQGVNKTITKNPSLINISFSYPCNLKMNGGLELNYCDPLGAALLCTAVTAAIKTSVAVVCLATGWIPIAGTVACGAATVAGGIVIVGCISAATSIVINTNILEDAIDEAIDQGIPIIVSSGNLGDIETFAKAFDLVIDISEAAATIEAWNLKPANMDGVFSVGAVSTNTTTPNREVENTEVHGNLTIWAPSPSTVWNINDSQTGHISTFGGTSAAAPYVSGMISLMQVIDPSLNPSNASLTNRQKSQIIQSIRNLLQGSAYNSSSPNITFVDNYVDRLINPHGLIQAVFERANIPFYEDLNYRSINVDNLSEPEDDFPSTPRIIDHRTSNNIDIGGEILYIPAKNNSPAIIDLDHIDVITPSSSTPKLYDLNLELTYLSDYDDLTISGDSVDELAQELNNSGAETTISYNISNLFNNGRHAFRLSGEERSDDNFYKLSSQVSESSKTIVADAFEYNNTEDTAFKLGVDMAPGYSYWAETAESGKYSIRNINFHSPNDKDYFILKNHLPDIDVSKLYKYELLTDVSDLDIEIIALKSSDGTKYWLQDMTSYLAFKRDYIKDEKFDLLISIQPKVQATYLEYDLEFNISVIPNPRFQNRPWEDELSNFNKLLNKELAKLKIIEKKDDPICLPCQKLETENILSNHTAYAKISKSIKPGILPEKTIDLRSTRIDKTKNLVFEYQNSKGQLYFCNVKNKKFIPIKSNKKYTFKKGTYVISFSSDSLTKLDRFHYKVRLY